MNYRPARPTWQPLHMRTVDPAPYRYAKPSRVPKLTALRSLFIAAVLIAWALIVPTIFTMVTA